MIPKWKLKAIVQKTISFLPQKQRINYWFQKHVTKGVNLSDEYFGYKIEHAADHLRFFRKYGSKDLSSSSVLELGTGWYPVVPIALFLNDLPMVHSLDLSNWTSADNIRTTCQKYGEWSTEGRLSEFLDDINPERWQTIMELARDERSDLDQMCEKINLHRWVGDARKTEFATDSIDLICSNNTFEHIPEAILRDILKEFQRIIKSDGVMSHFIDMSDHFAHFDSSINIYNFLRYDERTWNRIDNSIQPQNRMRFRDYQDLYEKLKLPISHTEVRPGSTELLAEIPLA